MITEVLVPELGSDPAEPVAVSVWFAEEGDEVFEGDRLVELLVGCVAFDVAAPADGVLTEQRLSGSALVRDGDVLGIVQTEPESVVEDEGSEG